MHLVLSLSVLISACAPRPRGVPRARRRPRPVWWEVRPEDDNADPEFPQFAHHLPAFDPTLPLVRATGPSPWLSREF